MGKRKPTSEERYEELMRNAGSRRRRLAQREMERLRHRSELRASPKSGLDRSALLKVAGAFDDEIRKLKTKIAKAKDSEERIMLRAELVHFETVLKALTRKRRPSGRSGGEASFKSFLSDRAMAQHLEKVLKAMPERERAFLALLIQDMKRGPKKPPPEAGLSVPAVPPKGPLPQQGGAQAPLDFGRD